MCRPYVDFAENERVREREKARDRVRDEYRNNLLTAIFFGMNWQLQNCHLQHYGNRMMALERCVLNQSQSIICISVERIKKTPREMQAEDLLR